MKSGRLPLLTMQEIWEMNTLERRYSVPPSTISDPTGRGNAVEDLHAWSIYRQNINSGFTDSALGSSEKSSPPYGNFKLRESTVQSIMAHPKYGPRRYNTVNHEPNGGASMYAYLKFGLPRVFPPYRLTGLLGPGGARDGSSGYDSSDDGVGHRTRHHRRHHQGPSPGMQRANRLRRSRSDPDFVGLAIPAAATHQSQRSALEERRALEERKVIAYQHQLRQQHPAASPSSVFLHPDVVNDAGGVSASVSTATKQKHRQHQNFHDTSASEFSGHSYWRDRRQKSSSEANLLLSSTPNGDERSRSQRHLDHHQQRMYTKNSSSRYGTGLMDERDSTVVSGRMSASGGGVAGAIGRQQLQSDRRSQGGGSTKVGGGSQMSVISHATRSSRTHLGGFNALAQAGGLLYSSREAQLLNEKFFPKDTFITTFLGDIEGGVFKHPHLQVRNLSYEVAINRSGFAGASKKLPYGEDRCRILDEVTLEIHGGELLAIMATSEEEGRTLLNVLANRHPRRRDTRLRGDLVVNGVACLPDKLEERVSYVQQDCSFTPDMSVRQTLLFTSLLKEPGNPSRGFDTKGRNFKRKLNKVFCRMLLSKGVSRQLLAINALIEDLGLGIVKHTRVKHLTLSEKRRLNVGCQLLQDTDIVLLDQPTKGMDIFDTFFLVEYLRQWAARGRIVILTIHPPTYEIFTMMSKIALMSLGRLMYFGKRREMLPYFAFIEFPCPAYKNPSDYYLDLVTLDNLSAEAMLESSERIKLLADTFHRRQEVLSDAGPPGIPPPKVKSANLLVQILALWIRALIYMFPYNLITLGKAIFVVATMSVLIGAIYENVRLQTEQDSVQDRFGFHYVMMAVSVWPVILLTITEVWCNKDVISRDLSDKLYSKGAYIISKVTYSFLTAGAVFLAYIIPAYCMSGLKGEDNNLTFSVYMAYMLLYLFSLRCLAMAMAYTFDSRHQAALVTGLLMTLVALSSGYVVHFLDLSVILFWLKWVSPMRWVLEQIDVWDMVGSATGGGSSARVTTFTCARNPLQSASPQSAAIIQKPPCSFGNGYEALQFFHYDNQLPVYVPVLVTLSFGLFWFVWTFVFFNGKRQRKKTSRGRSLRQTH